MVNVRIKNARKGLTHEILYDNDLVLLNDAMLRLCGKFFK